MMSVKSVCLGGLFFMTLVTARGVTVSGGTQILTTGQENQLQAWFGGSEIYLDNVFSHNFGDAATGVDFHNAVDGKGATLIVMRTTVTSSALLGASNVVGGYNTGDWSASGYQNTGPWIFNLTSSLQQFANNNFQVKGNEPGNAFVFGGGFDLVAGSSWDSGGARSNTYGGGKNVFGEAGFAQTLFNINRLEVFTVSRTAPVVGVPDTGSTLLLSAPAMFSLFAIAFCRKQSCLHSFAKNKG
jgi:hypothetical protein